MHLMWYDSYDVHGITTTSHSAMHIVAISTEVTIYTINISCWLGLFAIVKTRVSPRLVCMFSVQFQRFYNKQGKNNIGQLIKRLLNESSSSRLWYSNVYDLTNILTRVS